MQNRFMINNKVKINRPWTEAAHSCSPWQSSSPTTGPKAWRPPKSYAAHLWIWICMQSCLYVYSYLATGVLGLLVSVLVFLCVYLSFRPSYALLSVCVLLPRMPVCPLCDSCVSASLPVRLILMGMILRSSADERISDDAQTGWLCLLWLTVITLIQPPLIYSTYSAIVSCLRVTAKPYLGSRLREGCQHLPK